MTTAVLSASLRQYLGHDHVELSTLFDRLVAAFEGGDREDAAAMFRTFEQRLTAHLDFEDAHLLPAFAKVDAQEAAALAAAHQAIRTRLTELGVGVDLHLTRASAVTAMVTALRAHAAREDVLLYQWADVALDTPTRRSLLERLRAA